MDLELLSGKMAEGIKVITFKIKNKGMDNLHGLGIKFIKENGKMGNIMDMVF